MTKHIYILILIMVILGIFGGVVNYFAIDEDSTEKNRKLLVIKSILFGLAASFLVPLFLNTISSNLVKESEDDVYKLLVFSGFCLIASISSKSFISSVSEKVLKVVRKEQKEFSQKFEQGQEELTKEVKNVIDSVGPIITKEVEVVEEKQEGNNEINEDSIPDETLPVDGFDLHELKIYHNDDNETKVIKAIGNSKYTYRTLSGLSETLGVTRATLYHTIENLVSKEIVMEVSKNKSILYYLTANGRAVLNTLNNHVEGRIEKVQYVAFKNNSHVHKVYLDNNIVLSVYSDTDNISFQVNDFIYADTVNGERVRIGHIKKR